jgi:acid phosphatase class B
MNIKIILFVFLSFFLKEKNWAVAAISIPKIASDTCIELHLKSGKTITAKITSKSDTKIYFKKCGASNDTVLYFISKEKMDTIKAVKVQGKKDNRADNNRIVAIFGFSLLGFLLALVFFVVLAFTLFVSALHDFFE